jgi:hypothetical protein
MKKMNIILGFSSFMSDKIILYLYCFFSSPISFSSSTNTAQNGIAHLDSSETKEMKIICFSVHNE